MAIVVVAYSVFLRTSTLEERFPGGADGWRTACPNKTFRSDGRLCRVSFMTWPDVERCLADLGRTGINFDSEDPQTPIALTRQDEGLMHACEWLEVRSLDSGILIAWEAAHEASASTRSEGWDWDVDAVNDLLKTDESNLVAPNRPGVSTVRMQDGEPARLVGRAYMPLTEEQSREHDERYENAVRLAEPLILFDDRDAVPLDDAAKARLRRASADLDRALEIDPRNWNTCFLLGKVHERLGDDAQALECFLRGTALVPGHVEMVREASLAAGRLGRLSIATALAAKAISLAQEDAGLRMNLACYLVLGGDLEFAKAVANEALRLAVHDARIAAGHALIMRIASGVIPRPTTMEELERLMVS